jgi:hypothetical protein
MTLPPPSPPPGVCSDDEVVPFNLKLQWKPSIIAKRAELKKHAQCAKKLEAAAKDKSKNVQKNKAKKKDLEANQQISKRAKLLTQAQIQYLDRRFWDWAVC